jgi:GNAT superfamily N-acetyltransferase
VVQPVITTRRATQDDLDIIVADVQAGFDSYAAFAPEGWEPPDMRRDSQLTAELLAEPATWALIADAGGEPAGHVSFFPARERGPSQPHGAWRTRPLIEGLVHLWQLFIQPEWWGRGVAPTLHDAATAEMRARGFDRARLYTLSLHARAKRFYERRGWTAGAEEWNDYLSLSLTEYWLTL